MGGTIGVTVRFEDGSIEPMARWTNPTPFFINSYGLISSDKNHLDNYMESWYNMKRDYDLHHLDENYEYNMTSCYGGWRVKAPREYGMLVIDYKTKTILHCQGYTSYGLRDVFMFSHMNDDDEKEIEQLILNKKIKIVNFIHNKKSSYEEEFKNAKSTAKLFEGTLADFKKLVEETTRREFCSNDSYNDVFEYNYVFIDMNPWNIISYEESEDGLHELKNKMVQLGFSFTDEENKIWKKFCEKY